MEASHSMVTVARSEAGLQTSEQRAMQRCTLDFIAQGCSVPEFYRESLWQLFETTGTVNCDELGKLSQDAFTGILSWWRPHNRKPTPTERAAAELLGYVSRSLVRNAPAQGLGRFEDEVTRRIWRQALGDLPRHLGSSWSLAHLWRDVDDGKFWPYEAWTGSEADCASWRESQWDGKSWKTWKTGEWTSADYYFWARAQEAQRFMAQERHRLWDGTSWETWKRGAWTDADYSEYAKAIATKCGEDAANCSEYAMTVPSSATNNRLAPALNDSDEEADKERHVSA